MGSVWKGGIWACPKGGLVHVESIEREIDGSAVSAALDADPSFAVGGPAAGNAQHLSAWHAARIHHHCRSMGAPEAACERVGSLMSMRWTKRRGLGPGELMDEVLLHDAKVTCLGGDRDETIVREVADALHAMGRRATVKPRAAKRRRTEGVTDSRHLDRLRQEAASALAASGRRCKDPCVFSSGESSGPGDLEINRGLDLGDAASAAPSALPWAAAFEHPADIRKSRRARREAGRPAMRLPPAVVEEMRRATPEGLVHQLPLFVVDPRTAARSRAGSVVRSALALWLDSREGREWQAERQRRYESAAT